FTYAGHKAVPMCLIKEQAGTERYRSIDVCT
ncbi:MAG: hypothetical protein ACI9XK_004669, partial [Granulosicoccus sp.]